MNNLACQYSAIASYDKALQLQPDQHKAWYNKACCYAGSGDVEQAIANLEKAISLHPERYVQLAKTDADFDEIRKDERFQALMEEGALSEG